MNNEKSIVNIVFDLRYLIQYRPYNIGVDIVDIIADTTVNNFDIANMVLSYIVNLPSLIRWYHSKI